MQVAIGVIHTIENPFIILPAHSDSILSESHEMYAVILEAITQVIHRIRKPDLAFTVPRADITSNSAKGENPIIFLDVAARKCHITTLSLQNTWVQQKKKMLVTKFCYHKTN